MNDEWSEIKQKYENSVLQINVVEARYNSMRPYLGHQDNPSSGSGFIIDARRGLVVTNAHVAANALSITGRLAKLGRRDISMKLKSIVLHKDVAILQIGKEDLKLILEGENPDDISMKLGDNMKLSPTDNILVMGFPYGQTGVKFSTGIVSGFHAGDDTGFHINMTEDSYIRDPAYLQITAPLNPGVSGGPLVNTKGEVVGINSAGMIAANNIGYAIGTRTFLSLYKYMITADTGEEDSDPSMRLPTFNLRWNSMNDDMGKYFTGKPVEGIYVRDTMPDSVFSDLQRGDIISQISYKDPFWASDKLNLREYEKMPLDSGVEITALIDKHGDIRLCQGSADKDIKKMDAKCQMVVKRKLTFPDLVDMIPYGSTINIVFNRNKEWKTLKTKFVFKDTTRIEGVYPRFSGIEYKIVAGMCITPLLLNQMARLSKYQSVPEDKATDKFMYDEHLLICQVFPDTEVAATGNISATDLLTKVNDIEVKNLDDLDEALDASGEFTKFEVEDGGCFVISKENMKKDDKKVKKYMDR